MTRERVADGSEWATCPSPAQVAATASLPPDQTVPAYKNPALENGLTVVIRYNAAAEMLNRVLFAYAAECRDP